LARADVVIATYNRHASLNRCLEALCLQTEPDFGVILVDDGSDPPVSRTIEAPTLAALRPRIVTTPGNGGPARARNLGVRASEAEIVAFIDDDVVACPEWMERHLAAHDAGGESGIVIGPLRAPADWRPTAWNLWEARTLEVEYRRMLQHVYEPTWRQFFTGNASLRRETLLAAGGFNETFTRAEDIELAYRMHRLGARFLFEPSAIGWHYAERTIASWLAIPRAYARFDVMIDSLYPELEWLKLIESEFRLRHPFSRAGEATLRRLSAETPGVNVAVALARAFHAAGLSRLTVPLLSFAYSVEHRRSLARSTAGHGSAAIASGEIQQGVQGP
jgi:GT2 family glycosyltransferase